MVRINAQAAPVQGVRGVKAPQVQQPKASAPLPRVPSVAAAPAPAPVRHAADPYDALEYRIAGHPSHADPFDALEYRIAGHPSHVDPYDALEYHIEGHPSHVDPYDALEYKVPGHVGHVDPFAALEYKVGADPYADPVGPRSLRQWWNDHQPTHEEAPQRMAAHRAQAPLYLKKAAAAL